MSSVSKRLSELFKRAVEVPFNNSSKIILMSDCHRGDGTWSDNFLKNKNVFLAALDYYLNKGYTYIELGDGDELWENRNPSDIIGQHLDAFWAMSNFHKLNRLYLIYGNHDMCKKNSEYVKRNYYNYYDKDSKKTISLFDNIKIHEGIILTNEDDGYKIFLAHGHQGDFLNDKVWKVARFLVRHLWKHLELFGVKDPTSAAKNYHIKNKTEKKVTEWSNNENQMIIIGHTHRPVFPNLQEPLYFNTGSCVHPRCITGIEIENGNITLIKWSTKVNKDGVLYIGKEILEGPEKIINYFHEYDNTSTVDETQLKILIAIRKIAISLAINDDKNTFNDEFSQIIRRLLDNECIKEDEGKVKKVGCWRHKDDC